MKESPERATVPRVLFVDDQPQVAHAVLRLLPCRVDSIVVSSSLKAVRELEDNGPFDLIVTDLEMPGMWGNELLELVAERWPETRRALFTGHTSGELLERADRYADAVLDKVLDIEFVTRRICSLACNCRR